MSSKFSDNFKRLMGLGDEDDFAVTESGEEYDLPENVTIESKKPATEKTPKPAPKPEQKPEERKPQKSEPTPSEQPKKAEQPPKREDRQPKKVDRPPLEVPPQQKPAPKPHPQEQGFRVRADALDDEDEKIIARLLHAYKDEKQKKDNKDAQPAMEAALATLVAFAEKDETFAKKFYRAAKKFAPKVYGAFFKVGDQLISVTDFVKLPEGLTPEVYEIRDNKPYGKPLPAEKTAPILERLLQR